jgi:hypothetical protein
LSFYQAKKCDLVVVEKENTKVTSNLFYLVFYFLTNRKLVLRELEKDVSSVRLALCIHILLSSNQKIRLARGGESNVSGGPKTLQNIFLPPWSI